MINRNMSIEHLTKHTFLDKVFNYEQKKEWKFEGREASDGHGCIA